MDGKRTLAAKWRCGINPWMKGLRYLAYLGFAVGAFVFWALFYMLVLGVFPFPVEPACSLEPAGCPPPSVWKQLVSLVVVFGTIPLTALIFVFFRRWVRRQVGLQDE
jgi:hypothetical protein